MKFGPTRKELRFRVGFSVVGLVLMILALSYRGLPQGPAFFEVVLLAGGFFGGTLIWSIYRLAKLDKDEPE